MYKRLTRTWSKDTSWKTWWDKKEESQKVMWYREKRKIEDDKDAHAAKKLKPTVVKATEKRTVSRNGLSIMYKPWHIMKRDLIIEGYTNASAQQEWRRRCMDPAWKAQKVQGVWCLYEFQGLQQLIYSDESNASTAQVSSEDLTGDELKSMMADCDELNAKDFAALTAACEDLSGSPMAAEGVIPDEYVQGVVSYAPQAGWRRMDAVAEQLAALDYLDQEMADSWFMDEAVATSCDKQAMPQENLGPICLRLKNAKVNMSYRGEAMVETLLMETDNIVEHVTKVMFKGIDLEDPFKEMVETIETLKVVAQSDVKTFKTGLEDFDKTVETKLKEGTTEEALREKMKEVEKAFKGDGSNCKKLTTAMQNLRRAVASRDKALSTNKAIKVEAAQISDSTAKMAVLFPALNTTDKVKETMDTWGPLTAVKQATDLNTEIEKNKAWTRVKSWALENVAEKDIFVGG